MAPGKQRNRRNGNGRKGRKGVGPRDFPPLNTSIAGRDQHRFIRNVDLGTLSLSTNDAGYIFLPALSDVPNASEFTTLFDSWRIDRVDYSFMWLSGGAPTSAMGYPALLVAVDYDSNGAPASQSEMLQYNGMEVLAFSSSIPLIKRSLVPRFNALLEGSGGTATAKSPSPVGTFVDCDASATPMYGLRLFGRNLSLSSNSGFVRVLARYHMTFLTAR